MPEVIQRYFDAMAQGQWQAMARCYHDQASFADPLFPDLRGEQIVYHLHRLYEPNSQHARKQIELTTHALFSEDRKAQVQWELRCIEAQRPVKLIGLSTFAIWDQFIVRHVDEFPFHHWARQTQGLAGALLGRLPFYQRRLQRSARSQLDALAGTIGE